jgi:hypothetical protein
MGMETSLKVVLPESLAQRAGEVQMPRMPTCKLLGGKPLDPDAGVSAMRGAPAAPVAISRIA